LVRLNGAATSPGWVSMILLEFPVSGVDGRGDPGVSAWKDPYRPLVRTQRKSTSVFPLFEYANSCSPAK